MKRTLGTTVPDLIPGDLFDEQILVKFHYSKFKSVILDCGCKIFKDNIVVNGELYHRGSGRMLPRAFSLTEAKNTCIESMIFHVEK